MSRRFSFFVLLGTVVAVGVLFFHVIWPFLFPLFFAAVLALLFFPVYEQMVGICKGRRRIAAALMTVLIFLAGALPLSWAMYLVGQQMVRVGGELVEGDWRQNRVASWALDTMGSYLEPEEITELKNAAMNGVRGMTSEVYDRTRALISNVIGFVVGLVILGLSLYYFFAEGPAMLKWVQRISPMEDDDEEKLFAEFDKVCRGIVLATLVSALAQAVLAGIGFKLAGVERIWLLIGLTMMFSMVPFLGAAAVWLPVAVYLMIQGRYFAGVFLAVYGGLVVSTSDNFIKAHVLHGSSNLHPLVALITILGGLRVMGLWGIFVGPVVAAFFYALLKILHERVQSDKDAPGDAAAT